MSTIVLVGSLSTPDTVHTDDLYGRPPLPYELVGSRVRLAHFPSVIGDCTITEGVIGFIGFNVTVVLSSDVGLFAQAVKVDVQSAFTRPGISVIGESVVRYGGVIETSITGGNDMLTVVELSQVHIESEALLKRKSSEQFHTALLIPPLSVGASNLTITTCPLSENLADVITGAGVGDEGDRRIKGVDVLVYSFAFRPLNTRETKNAPLLPDFA